jgi:fructose 1,6-bisphosphatase
MQRSMSPRWKALIVAVIVYFLIRAVAEGFGFPRYRLFSEPFDLARLLIDVALWTVIYVTVHWHVTRRAR